MFFVASISCQHLRTDGLSTCLALRLYDNLQRKMRTGFIIILECKSISLHNLNYVVTNIVYRFVDRDIMMRYAGGGIGHRSTQIVSDALQRDLATSAEKDDVNLHNLIDHHDHPAISTYDQGLG